LRQLSANRLPLNVKNDADSHNDSHPNSPPIQISFDFTMDLAELEAAVAA